MWEIKLETASLASEDAFLFSIGKDSLSHRQEAFCVCSNPTRLLRFPGCARGDQQYLTGVPDRTSFRQMQVYAWTVCQRFSLGMRLVDFNLRTSSRIREAEAK